MKYEVKKDDDSIDVTDVREGTRQWLARFIVVVLVSLLAASGGVSLATGDLKFIEITGAIVVPLVWIILKFYFGGANR